ncbi:GMP synthase [Microbacterium sp. cx-59]|uniref:glutamine amidotransferase-related protein n=1 Tax=Microbacterium sp. cx-59 TaxID=2891207 RepID=UPI001E4DC9FB|nr:GMP synthase [Microbacterium sp. cx-59]MCC4908278.1 GMP synthase [Microbacterium sp. cx-59]
MDSRPLLYLCVRPEQQAAVGEYASFRVAMGLDEESLHAWDLVSDALPADALKRYRGFVVGGSPFNVAEPVKSEGQRRLESDLEHVAAAAIASRTLAMFTCYGIGVVTRMGGGDVSPDYAEPTGSTTIVLTEAGRRDPVFGVLPDPFEAFTAHKEGTLRLPEGAVLLAANESCPVQAYRLGDALYATQFHPELTPRAFTARMAIYRDAGYFEASEFDAVSARVLAAPVDAPARMLRAFATASVAAG